MFNSLTLKAFSNFGRINGYHIGLMGIVKCSLTFSPNPVFLLWKGTRQSWYN